MASRVTAALLAFVLALVVVGCASTGSKRASSTPPARDLETGAAVVDEEGIEVPDASTGDGADAWTAMESEGLTPVFADANDDISFDETRDGSRCEVVDQSPGVGEVVSEGEEIEITIDCAQVDWESEDGPGWEAFSEAYSSGFDDGCQALFDESPDGSLYEDDYEYSVVDCQNLNPGDPSAASDVPTDVPDDPQTVGAEIGELDGCRALFDDQGVWSLNWGDESLTADDCPVGAYVASSPRQPPTAKTKIRHSTKQAGETCVGTQSDGTPITMRIDKGEVNCSGARALWQDFLRRAPSEGAGSSGYTKIEGWGCAAATISDAPRTGSCERLDQSAGFTVYGGE